MLNSDEMRRYRELGKKEDLTEQEQCDLDDLELKSYYETQYGVRSWANGGM